MCARVHVRSCVCVCLCVCVCVWACTLADGTAAQWCVLVCMCLWLCLCVCVLVWMWVVCVHVYIMLFARACKTARCLHVCANACARSHQCTLGNCMHPSNLIDDKTPRPLDCFCDGRCHNTRQAHNRAIMWPLIYTPRQNHKATKSAHTHTTIPYPSMAIFCKLGGAVTPGTLLGAQ